MLGSSTGLGPAIASPVTCVSRVVSSTNQEDGQWGPSWSATCPSPRAEPPCAGPPRRPACAASRLVVVNSHRGGREFDREDAIDSEEQLEEVQRELRDAGVEHEVRQLVRGMDPADDLVNVATEVSAEFIVIGLRRRSPVGKLILGSNAQRVLLDAPCPVLAVKADED